MSSRTTPTAEAEPAAARGQHGAAGRTGTGRGSSPPPPYANLRSRSIPAKPADKKKGRRRMAEGGGGGGSHLFAGEAAAGPQLKRSGGMRRDWSFEDLRNRKANEGRKV
ncbi:hypothetical protein OPV22_018832 [Ensete ventricosum]|uniref:AT-hook motif nuclear-localized protein n=1 Tax=Ensete ventricosum TaxID=4639 RepID=A0AAV8QV35_ENSVE|nr:hypothetical protein OPV22_018832 [Ensete ventricosum]